MEGSWRAISHLTQLQRLSLVEVGVERLPRGVESAGFDLFEFEWQP